MRYLAAAASNAVAGESSDSPAGAQVHYVAERRLVGGADERGALVYIAASTRTCRPQVRRRLMHARRR
jgi:hypothetical protein